MTKTSTGVKTAAIIAVVAIAASFFIPNEIVLTGADNNKSIEISSGQSFLLGLESNPSTGYTWDITGYSPLILSQTGKAGFSQPEQNPELVGAPGTQTFHFRGISAGKTTLTLVYHRPWENATLQSFSVDIVVR
ncbi:MAG: protease inhibitor I42 family protein [Candidatus Aenigmatarchaeota archaeon]